MNTVNPILPQRTQSFTENFPCLSRCFVFKLCVTLCPLWCILFSSCDRRELTYYDEAEVTLIADWSQSGLDGESQHGATAMFYPTDGSAPVTVLMGDRTRQTVRLKEGTYNVILFNRSFNDFSGIAFRGMESYQTLEAYSKNIETRNDGFTRVVTRSPDDLAVDRIEGFSITFDMLGNYAAAAQSRIKNTTKSETETTAPCQLCFSPRKLTQEIAVKIRIKGIQNIRTATCTLGGMAESVFLATGNSSTTMVAQEVELGRPVLDPGSASEGTMTGTFNVFGFNEDLLQEMNLTAQLRDGETDFTGNLGNLNVNRTEEGGVVSITIDVTCDGTVPEVPPEGGDGGGFDIDVDGWGDDVNTEVPL